MGLLSGLFGGGGIKIDTSGAWSKHMQNLFDKTILPSVNQAIGSGQQIFNMAGQNASAFGNLFNQVPSLTQFNPVGASSAFGNVSLGQNGVNFNLSPELQNISSLLGNQATGFYESMMNPMTAAQDRFAQMEAILEPYRQREQAALDQRLFSRGQLGSTGGAVQQQAFMDAVNQQRNQNLLNAIQSAEQSNALTQQMGNNSINTMLGLQQLPLSMFTPAAQLSSMYQQAGLNQLQGMLSTLGGQQSAFGLMSILPELQLQPAKFAQSHQSLQNQLSNLNAQVQLQNDGTGMFGSLFGGLLGGIAGPLGSAIGSNLGGSLFGGGNSYTPSAFYGTGMDNMINSLAGR